MSEAMSADTTDEANGNYSDLTGFQRDLLTIIAGLEKPSGQNVLEEINQYMGADVTHGRLYPNLDTLVNKGFVEKGQLDRRTNYYDITEAGVEELEKRREWEAAKMGE